MTTKFFTLSSLALLLVGLSSLWLNAAADQVVHMEQSPIEVSNEVASNDDEYGRLTSCLHTPQPFVFQWKPKVLRPQTTFWFNFSIPMADKFSMGNANVTIWLKGIDDPIYKDSGKVECDKIRQFISKFIPDFSCPVSSGYVLKKFIPYKLDPSIPLPAGDYRIKVELQNESQTAVLCAEGDVSIEDQ